MTPASPPTASRSLNPLPLISIVDAPRLAANPAIGRLIDATRCRAFGSPYDKALTAIAGFASKPTDAGRCSAVDEAPFRMSMIRSTFPDGDGLSARNSGLSSVP
jgi:hypothetical protein